MKVMVKVRVCASLVFLLPFLCLAEVGLEDAIGVWLFDEGKGEVAKDSSANGNDGELIGGPKWVKGKFGQGLEFDGKGTSVETESADKLTALNSARRPILRLQLGLKRIGTVGLS